MTPVAPCDTKYIQVYFDEVVYSVCFSLEPEAICEKLILVFYSIYRDLSTCSILVLVRQNVLQPCRGYQLPECPGKCHIVRARLHLCLHLFHSVWLPAVQVKVEARYA